MKKYWITIKRPAFKNVSKRRIIKKGLTVQNGLIYYIHFTFLIIIIDAITF